MKHAIYALLALCFVVSGCEIATTETQQDDRLIITSPITGEKLQVALQDLDEMNWKDANEACANLGNGWRLPTKEELLVMRKELHLKGRGNFCGDCLYWSSTKYSDYSAWFVNFANGYTDGSLKSFYGSIRVRAVRALD
jgi:hypothetical protein